MLTLPSVAEARRLRDFFVTTGYDNPTFVERLGTIDPPLPQLRNAPRVLEQTQEPDALNSLIRWFFVGSPVPEETARHCLPEWFLQTCLDHRLLRAEGDQLFPATLLVSYQNLLLAADLHQRLHSADAYDQVLSLNPTARYLSNFTIRRPQRSTLDLGTGCGIQALVAAAHSEQVVATDLNARATAYAQFNARFNGLENIECVTGDLFEPVAGRTFDLIVTNPPFVLAPSKRFIYRDNEMELDRLCRRIVREAPDYLNEGGYFQMICEWAQIEDEPWEERISEWFDGVPCDVWVYKNVTRKPAWYAQTRLMETLYESAAADAKTFAEWMAYYHAKGVEAIHGGLIVMRRREGSIWFKIEEQEQGLQHPFGETVLQNFLNRDFLEDHADDVRLLASQLRLSPDAKLAQDFQYAEGHWQPKLPLLQLQNGIPYSTAITIDVAQFLARFDGSRTVEQLAQELISSVEVEPAQVLSECLKMTRNMVARGFLLP
jgi:methylase of polypeptide subunit release factors